MVWAGVPLRVMTSAALPVKAAKSTPPSPPGVMDSSPSASIAMAVIVVLPVPA